MLPSEPAATPVGAAQARHEARAAATDARTRVTAPEHFGKSCAGPSLRRRRAASRRMEPIRCGCPRWHADLLDCRAGWPVRLTVDYGDTGVFIGPGRMVTLRQERQMRQDLES